MHDHLYGKQVRAKADWTVIKNLLPYLWQFRVRIGLALALLVLAKLANVSVPLTLKRIVDSLDKSLQGPEVALVGVPVAMVIAYGCLRFSSVFFGELRDVLFGRVAERTLSLLGLKVFQHLQSLDLEYHLSRRTGGLSRDIERGTHGVSFLLRSLVFSVVPIFVEVAMVVAVFVWNYDLNFVWVTLLGISIYVAFSVVATQWRTRFVREANLSDSQANSKAIDSLLNFETVKYFTNETFEEQRYGESLKQREQAKVKNHFSLAALNTGQTLIISITITLMMLMAAQRVSNGEMTLGDLAMINALMIQVFIPLNFLGFVYREINRAMADVEAMFDVMKVKPSVQNKDDAVALPQDADGIHFHNVSFRYHPEREILHGVSFSVVPGRKVAIVGASGAGKSTIARLLFRFYDASEGRVCIGQHDVRDISLESLRAAIGVVPQDTVLFNDTIYENVRYGRPDAERREIEVACDYAMLTDFINKLPNGFETRVGERGLKVSGGEKQRIAIARALLKKPRIFLFDEATSSLDSHTEEAINRSLNHIASNHTTLVIAHRLSTVVDCDEILVLDKGRIVEQGSHRQLLQRQGAYARMWEKQERRELD